MPERLLVNYWYAHPVGHALEALRYCLDSRTADPELCVSVLLNEATPVELARLCAFIEDVYPVLPGLQGVLRRGARPLPSSEPARRRRRRASGIREPFHSLIPDPGRYPSFAWAALGDTPLPVIEADGDGEGPRTPSMSAARIREDLPELLDAAERLIGGNVSYEQALEAYFPRLLAAYDGDRSKVFSFDQVHEAYLR